eukprot:CAMPEP_0171972100 /NCGR_PEP_ID=MMETSP0993-20121228/221085_1 /TAXON_ID=483369 /ORGANISM="non described non described, Strain CCMP2098" /LENGTH=504 /DNA_ID=CAMNT_0012622577 /DNA_START=21 /DNA_END=1535 /DNA_ORIENTATION=+
MSKSRHKVVKSIVLTLVSLFSMDEAFQSTLVRPPPRAAAPLQNSLAARRFFHVPGTRSVEPMAAATTAAAARIEPPRSSASISNSVTKEVLSGFVVALASIPSSIAFANIAGVNPLVGIWSSVVLGLVSASVGGIPGLIAGAAGVVVVPLAPLLAAHGVGFMGPTVVLAALIELTFGLAKIGGKLVSAVDDNVLSGFLNGLGVLLFKSQIAVFAGLGGPALAAAASVAALTALVTKLLPLVTTAVPSALAGVVAATAATALLASQSLSPAVAAAASGVATLSDAAGAATFAGGLSTLPTLAPLAALSPPLGVSWAAAVKICGPAALSVAAISILETLLAGKVLTKAAGFSTEAGSRSSESADGGGDRALLGLGLGSLASAALGGFGGCGLIPQTVLNLSAGGRGALSSASYAVTMALSVLCLAPLIGAIPVASLAGVMLTVAASTVQVEWTQAAFAGARGGGTVAKAKLLVLLATSTICFKVDMAAGIGVGIALTALAKAVVGK